MWFSDWPNVGTQTIYGALLYDLNRVQGIRDLMRRVVVEWYDWLSILSRGSLAVFVIKKGE